jgi:hypothetical protein
VMGWIEGGLGVGCGVFGWRRLWLDAVTGYCLVTDSIAVGSRHDRHRK